MHILWRLLFCFIGITLVGCTMQPHAVIRSDTKQCLAQCTQRFELCNTSCSNNCALCQAEAKYSTIKNYAKYVHEEQVEGGYVTRGLKSYRDPLQCRKVTCSCGTDLMTCEQNCTGIIRKQLRTVPYCT